MHHLGDCWFFTASRLLLFLSHLALWVLVTHIHIHVYTYHTHMHVFPFNIPHNGYYVIITENNFQHIKPPFREIWIKLHDILRRHKNNCSLYAICLGWWWSHPGTFVNICHFWLPQFGDWIWYLVGRVHGYF